MTVEVTTEAPADWDDFVTRHEQASAYHQADAVSIGTRAFGLRSHYLTARDADGKLVGVLPLVEQSSCVFGHYFVSLPFFTYGGILANDSDVAAELSNAASALASENGADHVELRHSAPVDCLDYSERLDKVSMILKLPATEEQLASDLGSKLRSQIKRAAREEPEIVWGKSELLDDFYSVFAEAMHGLGTPVYSRRFFDHVFESMADQVNVIVVRAHNAVQAAGILVSHGSRYEVPWAAATLKAKRLAINMRMYWELLRFCIENGAESFDFGRSTEGSGTYRFKKQWGAEPVQLHWHYWMSSGVDIPALHHGNPKYALAASVWRRMPLWCANLIGPRISRYLP